MADKRSYKEILASVETSLSYINSHLGNIDQHLNRLNERTGDCEITSAKTSTRLSLLWKIGGGCATIVVALALKLFGVY